MKKTASHHSAITALAEFAQDVIVTLGMIRDTLIAHIYIAVICMLCGEEYAYRHCTFCIMRIADRLLCTATDVSKIQTLLEKAGWHFWLSSPWISSVYQSCSRLGQGRNCKNELSRSEYFVRYLIFTGGTCCLPWKALSRSGYDPSSVIRSADKTWLVRNRNVVSVFKQGRQPMGDYRPWNAVRAFLVRHKYPCAESFKGCIVGLWLRSPTQFMSELF